MHEIKFERKISDEEISRLRQQGDGEKLAELSE